LVKLGSNRPAGSISSERYTSVSFFFFPFVASYVLWKNSSP